jgi:hypothetical protein
MTEALVLLPPVRQYKYEVDALIKLGGAWFKEMPEEPIYDVCPSAPQGPHVRDMPVHERNGRADCEAENFGPLQRHGSIEQYHYQESCYVILRRKELKSGESVIKSGETVT